MLTHIRNAALGALAVLALAAPASAQSCTGDLNGDRTVTGADIGILLGEWGTPGGITGADIDGNGTVGGSDLGLLLGAWGLCPGSIVPSWATLVEALPDPAVVTDPALRAAIEATDLAWRVRDTATQVEMLLVPPGTFLMGCIIGSKSNQYRCYGEELPVHQVTLTNAFYLGRYEVTQAQWVAKMGSNPSYFKSEDIWVPASEVPNRPVETVSWTTIQGYLSATGFRLPTEAEWEFACRAGTQTPFHSGPGFCTGAIDDNLVSQIAWWCGPECSPTRPVGGKLANAFGFHDMLGNVWEWVNDWYGGYTADAQTNPTGPSSSWGRVFRGGSWNDPTSAVRSSVRGNFVTPGSTSFFIGFRVARNP